VPVEQLLDPLSVAVDLPLEREHLLGEGGGEHGLGGGDGGVGAGERRGRGEQRQPAFGRPGPPGPVGVEELLPPAFAGPLQIVGRGE